METACGEERETNGMTEMTNERAGFTPAEIDAAMASNEGLVRMVAARCLRNGVPAADEDLLQEGRIGLAKALRRFDRSRRTALSTYAVPWIRKHVLAELARRARHGRTFVASLDEPVGEDGETTLGDLRADMAAPDPFQATAEENLLERVFERLAELSAEDREVVELFFGIRGRKRASLSDIARARGVTPQRIHVRLHRALRRLRAACAA